MRLVIILLIISLNSFGVNDTTYHYNPSPVLSSMSLYLQDVFLIEKLSDDRNSVTFLLPSSYYFYENPTITIQTVDYKTGLTLSTDRYIGLERESSLIFIKGHFLIIIFVEDDTYIIELK